MSRTSIIVLLALTCVTKTTLAAFPDCVSGPLANNSVCDASLDLSTRARALLAVLTVPEKINATISASPGVSRLGLPVYEWWNEGLHGVANSPGVSFASRSDDFGHATSFPQPITLGASFDDELVYSVASVISTEARAFSNAGRAGLDFWTPNINPFRDPRWGRGQETPGEDPFHLSSYVKSLIAGLQGSDDTGLNTANGKYKKIVATCKHFAGYDIESWNGNYRYQFDAQISTQDMVEYYLPPFQACARDAQVGAFMCSYNAVNGVPTCADPWLLDDVLRTHWNWTGEGEHWVTSDCDAVQNVFLPHRWASSREGAAATSLKAGTDLNCGTYYSHHLQGAYDLGLINETDLDTALTRQYASLIRLGYFDPPASQPYRALNWSDVDTPESQTLARRAAESGIVLLKNNATLPLLPSSLSNKTLALIGDWANATSQLQGNYFGAAPYLHSPLYAAQQLPSLSDVLYAPGPGYGDPTTNSWDAISAAAAAADVIIYVGGIDNSVESEGLDRVSLSWTGAQLDLIGELALLDKPLIVVQMGGGQVDSSPLLSNPGIGALLWAGYPGQDGGTAVVDVITGAVAPAGRMPITQYPAAFAAEVAMTDMTLRPGNGSDGNGSPGRTYRWYEGDAVFPFGFGLHYTTFSAEMSLEPASSSLYSGSTSMLFKKQQSNTTTFDIPTLLSFCDNTTSYLDLCPFATAALTLTNTGTTVSDYVALLFLSGEFGPAPYPLKTLVAYARAHNVTLSTPTDLSLNLTLGSLSRVDESGNRVLYPGNYALTLDLEPGLASVNFTLTGEQAVLDYWPQPPANRTGDRTTEVGDGYFVGGFGSVNGEKEEVLSG